MKLPPLKNLLPKREGWEVGAALLFIAAGFVAIGLAWNGAAGKDFAQGQIPYLISGGAAGLALIGVGIALVLFEGARRSRVHLDKRLDLILEALQQNSEARVVSTNGHQSVPEGYVIVGRSSYHLPDCRLVAGKEDQQVMTPDEAAERGLAPCRVCAPDLVSD